MSKKENIKLIKELEKKLKHEDNPITKEAIKNRLEILKGNKDILK